jgi:membrane protease YdiL (CAAX protease family)
MASALEDALRLAVPGVLALLAAFALDRMTAARGLTPPGFRQPWRRVVAFLLMTIVFWVGITGPLGELGRQVEIDVTQLTTPQLFLLHAVLVVVTLSWFALGFAGVLTPLERREESAPSFSPLPGEGSAMGEGPGVRGLEAPAEIAAPVPAPPPPPTSLARQLAQQFGFVARHIPREIGLGLLLGIAAWAAVFVGVILFALLIYALGGEKALPKQPPALVPWIAGLPILVRLLISLSAGVVEEWFFRGFLQPRMGILLSTGFFVLAHFSYGQPFMLIGIAILSLIYGLLVKWRQNIWPAMAAHALFDGVQLLVIIPLVLRYLDTPGTKTAALLGF